MITTTSNSSELKPDLSIQIGEKTLDLRDTKNATELFTTLEVNYGIAAGADIFKSEAAYNQFSTRQALAATVLQVIGDSGYKFPTGQYTRLVLGVFANLAQKQEGADKVNPLDFATLISLCKG